MAVLDRIGRGAPGREPEQAVLLRTLTDMVAAANAGEGGLVGIQFAIELAAAATGAIGATFIEYGAHDGRVVAACGEMGFMLGRRIDIRLPSLADIVTGPSVRDVRVRDLVGIDGVLPGAGVRRFLRASAEADGAPVGALQVYFRDEEDRRVPEPARSWVALLAACAAHLYADGSGLPVYETGPHPGPVSLAVAVVGRDGNVLSWNPAAERLTAQSAASVLGGAFPFPLPGPGQSVDHQMACGTWIKIRATRLAGSDSVALSLREQTETVRRERSRDLFLTVASHELRTPVTVIRGYADTLLEHWEALDEPARHEAVAVMGNRARELARLVDRLLTAASDAAGLIDGAPPVPFDVVDTLREVATELTPEVRAAVRLDLPAELPKAAGDRPSVAMVVTELVTNARKYSPTRVQVDMTAGADGQTVWFRVADRGVGIRPEHVEQAFERFWQLETGDQRRYGGVGLGLYLVRRLVERQNGWVSLRPRDGGGTVAEVRLPRADVVPGVA
jgi:two-component system, OmpR family, phosphate regulon sensor histidine kinase PhoR